MLTCPCVTIERAAPGHLHTLRLLPNAVLRNRRDRVGRAHAIERAQPQQGALFGREFRGVGQLLLLLLLRLLCGERGREEHHE